jgi:ribosomal protein S18 acetylase RimI-like enzyme
VRDGPVDAAGSLAGMPTDTPAGKPTAVADDRLVLRRVTPDDAAGVAAAGEVTVAGYAEFGRAEGDPYTEKLRDAGARAREAELWVAEVDGAVVGTVTVALPGSVWQEIAADGEGEFRMLAVSPAARGRGVGDALVGLVLERCRAAGCSSVVLSSLTTMRSAHRLYERRGFRRLPERDWTPVPGVDLLGFGVPLDGDAVAGEATP